MRENEGKRGIKKKWGKVGELVSEMRGTYERGKKSDFKHGRGKFRLVMKEGGGAFSFKEKEGLFFVIKEG